MDTTTYTPTGRNLVAGDWIAGPRPFRSTPVHGPAHDFTAGSPDIVDTAVRAAEEAFASFGQASREDRAALLEAIADAIEARGAQITAIGTQETGLPEGRLEGERGRTCGQLRLFAAHVRGGAFLDIRHDAALPDRTPLPRPDLRMVQRPLGPVAVFGASNFPLAFSTAGGDTASALAAGCPVVVKGHPAHPGTGEIVAEAIAEALKRTGTHPGVFSLIQGGDVDIAQALVRHPLIKAVGFTGSLKAGRALFELCAARPEPIPFFGELGSVNPMFLMPAAMAKRAEAIGKGWAASLTMGVGQFCTNPGLVVAVDGPDADTFVAAAEAALADAPANDMLTDGIAAAFREGRDRMTGTAGVETRFAADAEGRKAGAVLLDVAADAYRPDPGLAHEVFGPLGLVVRVKDAAEMEALARDLDGQLTCTLHLAEGDTDAAARLLPILERKAGRILANGFPTGVEVADAMVHGGPYPASTNFGHTSVGTLAIRRFQRPVCYQDMPEALLPEDLRI